MIMHINSEVINELEHLNKHGYWFTINQTPDFSWVVECVNNRVKSEGKTLLEAIENFVSGYTVPVEYEE